jgi:hypothetical protein
MVEIEGEEKKDKDKRNERSIEIASSKTHRNDRIY